MTIFRAYDIRGVYGKDLTTEVAEDLGKAFGTYVGGGLIAVGRDCRLSSPVLRTSLIAGLSSAGCSVLDVGMVPTPLLYFSLHHLKADGGIMITGSHNPAEYNGFKLCKGTATLFGEDIQDISRIIASGKFATGGGSTTEKGIIEDYIRFVSKKIKLPRKLKVVLDAGNGAAGEVAVRIFRELGCQVIPLYCEPDGRFPNHHPDPTVDSALADLIAKVRAEKADFGVAYDGDGDRAGFVDDSGDIIRGDQALILFARSILEKHKGAKIIFEVKCSQAVIEDVSAHGGVPIMYRTGHSFIKKKMKEEKALLAGEMSGHFFFADDYLGYDDAIFASLRMASLLSDSKKKLSELVSSIPKYESTPEIRVRCPEDLKFKVVKDVVERFKQTNEVITVDGARIQFGDGWGLVRASNTEPALILRFEAKTAKRLAEIRKIVESELRKYPQIANNL
jgi:phosphomannomutase/phosphoglucomutase